ALLVALARMALGVACYLRSHIAPTPVVRSMLVVSKLSCWDVSYSRAAVNIALVSLALLFGGAIGIGTLIDALFSGLLIGFFLRYVKKQTKYRSNLVS